MRTIVYSVLFLGILLMMPATALKGVDCFAKIVPVTLQDTESEVDFLQNTLFDKSLMACKEQNTFERCMLFIDQLMEELQSGNDKVRVLSGNLIHRIIFLMKKVFIRLETLTVGKTELGPLYGCVVCPFSYQEVQKIALNVLVCIIDLAEKQIQIFFQKSKDTYLVDCFITADQLQSIILTYLPKDFHKRWWHRLWFFGVHNIQAMHVAQIISYDLYAVAGVALCDNYLRFIAGKRKQQCHHHHNQELDDLGIQLSKQFLKLKQELALLSKNSVYIPHVEILLFNMLRLKNVVNTGSKIEAGCDTNAKIDIFLRHRVLCDDELLRKCLKDRAFAEYFNRYCNLIERYLTLDECTFVLKYEIYALYDHISRFRKKDLSDHAMPAPAGTAANVQVTVTWWELARAIRIGQSVKDFFYGSNALMLILDKMLENLESIVAQIGNMNHAISTDKQEANNIMSAILQGNLLSSDNDKPYLEQIKKFIKDLVNGNVADLKQGLNKIVMYASPVIVIMLFKVLMPGLADDLKSAIKAMLGMGKTKADFSEAEMRVLLTDFLEKNPDFIQRLDAKKINQAINKELPAASAA